MLFKKYDMSKKKDTVKIEVSSKEAELIMAIRNYVDSYPDGHPKLLEYAQDLFDDLVDVRKK